VKIFPKELKFFDQFELSAQNLLKGAKEFLNLLENYQAQGLNERIETLRVIEHEGDIITHETIEKLNTTFLTPIDREDIHALISKLDDVLDFIESSAVRMQMFKINCPTEQSIKLTVVLYKAVEQVVEAISRLRNIKQPESIIHHCIEINRLENEGDIIQRAAIADLFECCINPIEIIKWKEIYENIETAIDKCEDVANVIEGIVLKNA
jgi:predicted phosphate transport protein (TIGR00153 family)